MGPISGRWAQFPARNEVARFSTQIKLQLLHVTLNHFHSLILRKLFKKLVMRALFRVLKSIFKKRLINILLRTDFLHRAQDKVRVTFLMQNDKKKLFEISSF